MTGERRNSISGDSDSTDCAVEFSNTSIDNPKFVPRHRRIRSPVSRADLIRFRAEVLGVPPPTAADKEAEEDAATQGEDLAELNLAFSNARMSLTSNTSSNSNNSTSGNVNSSTTTTGPASNSVSPGPGLFTNFFDNNSNPPSMSNNMPGVPRHTPSPGPSLSNGVPGNMPGMNVAMPMNAGHQMDLNHLYEMVLELSEVLRNNRDMTKGIINSAEEIMKRATTEGASPTLQQANGEISAARIAELERALAREKRLVEFMKREQVENARLIGEHETAVGTMVEQIRHYCQNNNMQYLSQKRHYNNLLQAERDAHLESRLDRDYWHAQTMKCAEMVRTAYKLRSEEEEVPIRVVAGLQNEVRAYRNALGMEPEKPEEEYGWEILKDVPPGVE